MEQEPIYSRSTEIRHIAPEHVYQLGKILEDHNGWRKLMEIIPKSETFTVPLCPDIPKKYTQLQIREIADASCDDFITFRLEILFEEWGTSGKKRPTVETLLVLLIEAQLFRAAHYVAVNFLNEPPPSYPPTGPAARIDISLPPETEEIQELDVVMENVTYPGTSILVQHAAEASNINNLDYRSKHIVGNCPKVQVTGSDLQLSEDYTVESNLNLPNISALGTNTQNGIEMLPSTRSNNISAIESDRAEEMTESSSTPVSSAFNVNSVHSVLPNLSGLNLNGLSTADSSITATSSNTSLSTNNDDHDHDQNQLNLPILNGFHVDLLEQSSLDDSSLTNVTETSDEPSFESQTRLNVSETNLPIVSLLHRK